MQYNYGTEAIKLQPQITPVRPKKRSNGNVIAFPSRKINNKVSSLNVKELTLCILLVSAIFTSFAFYLSVQGKLYPLKKQIVSLEKEVSKEKMNCILLEADMEIRIDYDAIYKEAYSWGMRHPSKGQMKTYDYKKGNRVIQHANIPKT